MCTTDFTNVTFRISHWFSSCGYIWCKLLWPSDAIWRHGVAQIHAAKHWALVTVCCLTKPKHHLNQRSLLWRHNGRDSISNHQPHDCLLNRLFRRRSKKTTKLSVTGLCAGNSPGTGEFPAQMASYAEHVSIWWRHHVKMFPFDDVIHTFKRFATSPRGQWVDFNRHGLLGASNFN